MIKLFINIELNDTNNQSVGFRTSLLILFLHNLTSKKANPPFFLGSSTSLSLFPWRPLKQAFSFKNSSKVLFNLSSFLLIFLNFSFASIFRYLLINLTFLTDLCKHPVDGFSAGLVDETNIFEWSVTIIGPPDTL
jgi:hypothetical protein